MQQELMPDLPEAPAPKAYNSGKPWRAPKRGRGRPSKQFDHERQQQASRWARQSVPVQILRMRTWSDEQLRVIDVVLKWANRGFLAMSGKQGFNLSLTSVPTWFETLKIGEEYEMWAINRTRCQFLEDGRPKNEINEIRLAPWLRDEMETYWSTRQAERPSKTQQRSRRTRESKNFSTVVKNQSQESPDTSSTESKSSIHTTRSTQKSKPSATTKSALEASRSKDQSASGSCSKFRDHSCVEQVPCTGQTIMETPEMLGRGSECQISEFTSKLVDSASPEEWEYVNKSFKLVDPLKAEILEKDPSQLASLVNQLREQRFSGLNPQFFERKLRERGILAVLCLLATSLKLILDEKPPKMPAPYLAGMLNKPLDDCHPIHSINDRICLADHGRRKAADGGHIPLPSTRSSTDPEAMKYNAALGKLAQETRLRLFDKYRIPRTSDSKARHSSSPNCIHWKRRAWAEIQDLVAELESAEDEHMERTVQ